MSEELERDVGRLEGTVASLTKSIDELKKSINDLSNEVKSNKELIDNAKGGLRLAVWFIGAAGVLGALVNELASWLINGVK